MKDNISKLKDCYGCGICVKACPTHIIALKLNSDGFYTPVISDRQKCIECGLCLKVCAFNHSEVAAGPGKPAPRAYAAWSNDPDVRRRCSSGGVGFEIGKALLAAGYKAVGVRYNPQSHRAEHYVASTLEEFIASTGSKYIPSYTVDALMQLDRTQKYFFTGTPCQIDSMRRHIRHFRLEDNFVLLDFFCHGVPSQNLWLNYERTQLTPQVSNPTFVSWRTKRYGWHDSWAVNASDKNVCATLAEPEYDYSCRWSRGDLFYKFFLDDLCLNHCCYTDCKYKRLSSAADLRIGDLWGQTYESDNKGVSALIAFTERGNEVIESIKSTCTLQSQTIDTVAQGQIRKVPKMPRIRSKILQALKNEPLARINDTIVRRYEMSRLPQRAWRKIKCILNK